jgi:hypothetical protein
MLKQFRATGLHAEYVAAFHWAIGFVKEWTREKDGQHTQQPIRRWLLVANRARVVVRATRRIRRRCFRASGLRRRYVLKPARFATCAVAGSKVLACLVLVVRREARVAVEELAGRRSGTRPTGRVEVAGPSWFAGLRTRRG